MIPDSVVGELSVLNCTEGDIRVCLDNKNPVDIARAERIITDMLKRGYMLFIQEGKSAKLKRVQKYDPKTKEYIVAEGPLYSGEGNIDEEKKEEAGAQPKATRKGKKGPTRRVPISKARATGIAPTAGG